MIGRTVASCVTVLTLLAAASVAAKPLRLPDTQLLPASFKALNGWAEDEPALDLDHYLKVFRDSCEPILRRARTNARVKPIERALRDPCSRAVLYRMPVSDKYAREFFEENFRPVRISRVGESQGFITGYYEPVIEGSRKQQDEFDVPFYRRPPDLRSRKARTSRVKGPSRAAAAKRAKKKRGPYYDRAAIEDGALEGRGLELVWTNDAIDAFKKSRELAADPSLSQFIDRKIDELSK